MYDSLTKTSGIEAVSQYLANFQVETGPDGLSLVTGDGGSYGADVEMPERLREFLIDLRLLRHLPLAYLVPDAALLPPREHRGQASDHRYVLLPIATRDSLAKAHPTQSIVSLRDDRDR